MLTFTLHTGNQADIVDRIGAPNLPMAAISEAKRNYSKLDHTDWVQWWNAVNHQNGRPDKNIDFHWADIFPIRTPTVLRAVFAEPRLVDVLCTLNSPSPPPALPNPSPHQPITQHAVRACWESNKDMSSDPILHDVIADAGYDADAILAKANSAEVKADLRARTKEAKETGICGVPSYRIFRRSSAAANQEWELCSDIVWGQDELAVVEDLIAGWDGVSSVQEGRSGQDRSSRL